MKALLRKGKALISIGGESGTNVLYQSSGTTAMTTENEKILDDAKKHVADLYWLAFLLTERQDLSIEIASDAVSAHDASPFADWMRGWQRRLVIGRALSAIHDELVDSARRTPLMGVNGSSARAQSWSLDPNTTKADLEQALLAIDPFPRAALLLLVFEGMPIAEAATLLDADPALIRKAQAIGLRELTANLADEHSPKGHRGNRPAPRKLCSWLRTMAVCH